MKQLKISEFIDLVAVEEVPKTVTKYGMSKQIIDAFLGSGLAICKIKTEKYADTFGSTINSRAKAEAKKDPKADYKFVRVAVRKNPDTQKIDSYIYRLDKYNPKAEVRVIKK